MREMKKTVISYIILVCIVFMGESFLAAAEKIPECKDGFGASGLDHTIIYYQFIEPKNSDICRGGAAVDFVEAIDDPRAYVIPKILQNPKSENLSFAIFAGFVLQQDTKNFLIVDQITIRKDPEGKLHGWKVLSDHTTGKEIVRRFGEFSEEEVSRITRGSFYVLVVRIDRRATDQAISSRELNLILNQYRFYISSTVNIECHTEQST